MPRRTLPLTDTELKKAKPQEKPLKLSDGGGLYLLVTPSGGKLWYMKYLFTGKEKKISFGAYPAITLLDARQRRDDARKLLANGIDPSQVKKAMKEAGTAATDTFETIAREWHTRQLPAWSDSHATGTLARLEKDVFPYLGKAPIATIKAMHLLEMLRRVEDRGAVETAHRLKIACGQVFRYAVASGRAEHDPTAALKGALSPRTPGNHAAITDPKEVVHLLRAIDDFPGYAVTRSALKLAPLLFVRPGELRQMEWAELDLDGEQWNIPANKMKTKHDHIVPLSKQAVALLRDIQPITGSGRYVFPNARSPLRPMSEVALLAALRRIGYSKEEMTVHGFRAMARTILDEVLGFPVDHIEHQLAHAVKDANGRAYNRTSHLPARRAMMQQWADYLDGLKAGAKVLPLKRAA